MACSLCAWSSVVTGMFMWSGLLRMMSGSLGTPSCDWAKRAEDVPRETRKRRVSGRTGRKCIRPPERKTHWQNYKPIVSVSAPDRINGALLLHSLFQAVSKFLDLLSFLNGIHGENTGTFA